MYARECGEYAKSLTAFTTCGAGAVEFSSSFGGLRVAVGFRGAGYHNHNNDTLTRYSFKRELLSTQRKHLFDWCGAITNRDVHCRCERWGTFLLVIRGRLNVAVRNIRLDVVIGVVTNRLRVVYGGLRSCVRQVIRLRRSKRFYWSYGLACYEQAYS